MGEFNLPPGVNSSDIPGNEDFSLVIHPVLAKDLRNVEDCEHGYLLSLDCPECEVEDMKVDQEPLKHTKMARKVADKPVQLDKKGRILPKHKRKRAKLTPERAAKREENLAKARLNQPITITLQLQHTRNGVNYGPGTGKLPRSLALELLAEEQAHRRAETRFYGAKSAIIGPRDKRGQVRVIDVPSETFELPYDNPNLYADRIDGTKHGSDTGEGGKF
mgnify:CR=1 FL=1